jgi:hypothetical protein
MMPHYYQYIHGWFVQEHLYTQMVESCNDFDAYHFVEVGSWKGKSSTYMGVEILNSNKKIKFDCVDTWLGSEEHIDSKSSCYEPLLEIKDGLYNEFLKNIEPLKSVINPIRMTSVEASTLYEDESLDFVYIDGAHDYDSVYDDIQHWFPKVKVGGYIGGDDLDWKGVNMAVYDNFEHNFISIKGKTWIKQKHQV